MKGYIYIFTAKITNISDITSSPLEKRFYFKLKYGSGHVSRVAHVQ